MIVDTGQPAPMFRVELKDDPIVCFSATTPTDVWKLVVQRSSVLQNSIPDGRKVSPFPAVSGPLHYGLDHPLTLKLIRKLPGAFGSPQD
jgi:hypothetical protein